MATKSSATYNDKLKGISTEKAVDAIDHALALCNERRFGAVDRVTYHTKFVPEFMAYLGLTDVEKVPARSTLTTLYQSHLAKKKEDATKKESETYHPTTSSTRRRLAPVTKSPEDELAKEMATARATFAKALMGLSKATGNKRPTRDALRALGLSGGEITGNERFQLDDKPLAMRWAAIALPKEHGLDFEQMPDGKTVWRGLIGYYQGLGDGALKERIAATQELCAEASFQRHSAKPQNVPSFAKAAVASAAASKKRFAKDQKADKAAHRDLKRFHICDAKGALPGQSTPFGAVVVPQSRSKLPHYVAPPEQQGPTWGQNSKTGRSIIVKSAELLAKICLGSRAYYDVGIGTNQDQVPIATIERKAPGDAAVAIDGAWAGWLVPDDSGSKFSHRGRNDSGTLLVDVYKPSFVFAAGGDYDWKEAMPQMGLRVASAEPVQTDEYGPLDGFLGVCFVDVQGGIPGGLKALDDDRARFALRMRDAVAAHGDGVGSVRLGPFKLEKLAWTKPAAESNFRAFICGPQRCEGVVNDETLAKLNWLEAERFAALHYVADKAARSAHVKMRLLSYAHAGSGPFHFDGAGDKPQTSKRMATSHAMSAPANFDSLNFSLSSGPKPARMGPLG